MVTLQTLPLGGFRPTRSANRKIMTAAGSSLAGRASLGDNGDQALLCGEASRVPARDHLLRGRFVDSPLDPVAAVLERSRAAEWLMPAWRCERGSVCASSRLGGS